MWRRILKVCMFRQCQRLLGTYLEVATGPHPGVSHGLCQACLETHYTPRENRRVEA